MFPRNAHILWSHFIAWSMGWYGPSQLVEIMEKTQDHNTTHNEEIEVYSEHEDHICRYIPTETSTEL